MLRRAGSEGRFRLEVWSSAPVTVRGAAPPDDSPDCSLPPGRAEHAAGGVAGAAAPPARGGRGGVFTLLNLSDAEDAEAADDGGPARLPAPNRSPHRRPSMTTSR
jgi:hypothetical protein